MALAGSSSLSLYEFQRIAENTDQRMEFIYGEIYNLAAPTQKHQTIVGNLYAEILGYIRKNKGSCTPLLAPFDVILDQNLVQPDVMVICDPTKLDGKRCNGAPDWVIEVTSSNAATDYREKLRLYRENGVREYWIIDPDAERVTVLFFEQNPNLFMMYTFEQSIPVSIYKDAAIQLQICVAELLS